jgi:hypothetical protein
MKIPLKLLLLLLSTLHAGVGGQLTITVTDDTLTGDANAHSFSDNDNQIATSLLESDTPALLFGVVSSADVNKVCTQFSKNGKLSFNATLAASGGDHFVIIKVLKAHSIQSCLRTGDSSGTQVVLLDNNGQQSALLCPNNAGSTSCGIYVVQKQVKDWCCYWCCIRGGDCCEQ